MTEEVKEEYRSSLSDLKFNSKPLINMLTMLAEEYSQYSDVIVQVIETHIHKAKPTEKLPCLYLIDSIMKNVHEGNYVQAFTNNIVQTFCGVFEKVDEKTRQSMFKLRQTWSTLFPGHKLYAIDVRVSGIDPAWPITAKAPESGSIHVNPKFLKNKQEKAVTAAPVAPTTAESTTTATTAAKVLEMVKSNTIAKVEPKVETPEDLEKKMREQLIAKQQELLKLQQQRLELELAETKAKLEQQAKELRAKEDKLKEQEQKLQEQKKQDEQKVQPSQQHPAPQHTHASQQPFLPQHTQAMDYAVPIEAFGTTEMYHSLMPSQPPPGPPPASTGSRPSTRDPRVANNRDPRLSRIPPPPAPPISNFPSSQNVTHKMSPLTFTGAKPPPEVTHTTHSSSRPKPSPKKDNFTDKVVVKNQSKKSNVVLIDAIPLPPEPPIICLDDPKPKKKEESKKTTDTSKTKSKEEESKLKDKKSKDS
ncbi:unnamed protein product, partial [Owenia fusiformis]